MVMHPDPNLSMAAALVGFVGRRLTFGWPARKQADFWPSARPLAAFEQSDSNQSAGQSGIPGRPSCLPLALARLFVAARLGSARLGFALQASSIQHPVLAGRLGQCDVRSQVRAGRLRALGVTNERQLEATSISNSRARAKLGTADGIIPPAQAKLRTANTNHGPSREPSVG